jgi:hypothetical protein
VSVTVYFAGWEPPEPPLLGDPPPQPTRNRVNAAKTTNRVFHRLPPPKRRKKKASGEANASIRPVDLVANALLVVGPTVSVVVSVALPDSVAGANVQPHPLGKPEQANATEAANPFSGVTVTVKVPGAVWVAATVPVDSVRL